MPLGGAHLEQPHAQRQRGGRRRWLALQHLGGDTVHLHGARPRVPTVDQCIKRAACSVRGTWRASNTARLA
eukprot:351737-Chlamydomonas_euryale.AAC.15